MSSPINFHDVLSRFQAAASEVLEAPATGVSRIRKINELKTTLVALNNLASTPLSRNRPHGDFNFYYRSCAVEDPVETLLIIAKKITEDLKSSERTPPKPVSFVKAEPVALPPPSRVAAPLPPVTKFLCSLNYSLDERSTSDKESLIANCFKKPRSMIDKTEIQPQGFRHIRVTELCRWALLARSYPELCRYDQSTRKLIETLDTDFSASGSLKEYFENCLLGASDQVLPLEGLPIDPTALTRTFIAAWPRFFEPEILGEPAKKIGTNVLIKTLEETLNGESSSEPEKYLSQSEARILFKAPSPAPKRSLTESLASINLPLALSREDFDPSDDPEFNKACESAILLVKWIKLCLSGNIEPCLYDRPVHELFHNVNVGFGIAFKEECFEIQYKALINSAETAYPVSCDWVREEFQEQTLKLVTTIQAFCKAWNILIAPRCRGKESSSLL